MPTLEFVASSSRQTSHQSSEEFNEAAGPLKSKRKNVSKDKVDALPKKSKKDGKKKLLHLRLQLLIKMKLKTVLNHG